MAADDERLLVLADASPGQPETAMYEESRQRRLHVVAMAALLGALVLWTGIRAVLARPVPAALPAITQVASSDWSNTRTSRAASTASGSSSAQVPHIGRDPVGRTSSRVVAVPVAGCPNINTGTALDLNTATAAQLDSLPGVGPVLAQRIVTWRTSHRGFSDVHELQEVPGIGPSKYARLRPFVRLS